MSWLTVDVVTSLAGVVDVERMNAGIVLTTSRFSKVAHKEAAKLEFRMSVTDFTVLKTMLEPFKDQGR